MKRKFWEKGVLTAIRNKSYKYIRRIDDNAGYDEFYDLTKDPFEKENLSEVNNPEMKSLSSSMDQLFIKSGTKLLNPHQEPKYDAKNETIKELKTLGYM